MQVEAKQLLGRCTSALDSSASCGHRSHVEDLLSRAAEAQGSAARAADYERLMQVCMLLQLRQGCVVLCTLPRGSHMHVQVGAAALNPIGAARENENTGLAASESIQPAPLYNSEALRLWLLKCCQASRGGLRDKPGKPVDYYHTCYCLSGYVASLAYAPGHSSSGDSLAALDPVCNVLTDKLAAARLYFGQRMPA